MNNKRRQVPGQPWTFINRITNEIDSGILPELGKSNTFAKWDGRRNGHWNSRKFSQSSARRLYKGEGPSGLLGRMKSLLTWSRKNSSSYRAPEVTAARMVEIWESQKGLCAACGSPIDVMASSFDHCHISGKPRGFIHRNCNTAEGMLARMSDDEFISFVKFVSDIRRSNMPKIDECYNQPTDMASAGTTTPAGKTDTVSPSRFSRNMSTEATEKHDLKALRDKQLGSNGMQSNGFSSKVAECNHPAPRRGFDQD